MILGFGTRSTPRSVSIPLLERAAADRMSNWWGGKEDNHTNSNLLLPLPDEGQHGLAGIAEVPLVVGDILLDILLVVADGLLEGIGCLRCHLG